MKLVIVESPSKSKTITKYLGEGFVVRASVGHVRDLPKSSKKAIDIEGGFIPHYEVVAKKEVVIADITAQAAKADEIILATDPDREGEAIAWHIAEVLKERLGAKVGKKMKRITFHEITKEAVLEAMKQPRLIDEHLREAQEARRVLDRIVGYDLSGLIWKKVRYGLSAGRVQSPALRIIMEREREIRAFIPEKYWVIEGLWNTNTKDELKLKCSKEPRERAEVDHILETARKEDWKIIDIEETEQKRSPRAPFITSTLQQAASSRLGYSPSRTMGIAQKLYESGYITYMRTDSTNLGQQALDQIGVVVKKEYGEQYLSFRKYSTKSKNAQEAHEAIRPSHFDKENAGHNDEQKRLYRLIWQRAVASQMSDARVARTKIVANIAKGLGDRVEGIVNADKSEQDSKPYTLNPIPSIIKPRMASIPKTMDPSKVTVADAMKYLSLPRTLGKDPKTGNDILASAGRFGPYINNNGEYRSIKIPDDVYEITLERALEMLAIPKAVRKGRFAKKVK